MAKTELTLVIPGLAAIVASDLNNSVLPAYLSKILKRARFYPHQTGFMRLLFNYFSEHELTTTDLPVVSLDDVDGVVLRADPCYLHADRDKLLVFSENLEITEQETMALIAEIQPLLTDLPAELVAQTNNKWLFKLREQPNVSFHALPELEGQAVESSLPEGEGKRQWLTLWNEIQMQLYDCEINQQRIANNKLPINSLWFWGKGSFSVRQAFWRSARGNVDVLKKLASKANVDYQNSDIKPDLSFSSGQHLTVLDEVNVELDWQQQLDDYDQVILKPLWQQLAKSQISKLTIDIPNSGRYQLTRFDTWKFWQK